MALGHEFRQNQRINEANRAASRANRYSENMEEKLGEIEARTERLTLLCQAMWEILQAKAKFPDELLVEKLAEIKHRDFGPNGKKVFFCDSCGRALNKHHLNKCMYCGKEQDSKGPFDMM